MPRTRLKRVAKWGGAVVALAMLAFLIAYARSDNDCGRTIQGDRMKAIVFCDYGTAEVLRLEDIEKPAPGDDEVLIRVRAASVNPLDWHNMRGTPYVMRLGTGPPLQPGHTAAGRGIGCARHWRLLPHL
jgi:hypothetical protein